MEKDQQILLLVEEIDHRNYEMLEKNGYKVVRTNDLFEDSKVVAILTKVSEPVSADLMSRFESLRYVLAPVTSPDMVDRTYIEKKGLRLITLREPGSPMHEFRSTTEIVVWHMIGLMRNAFISANSVRKGIWNRDIFYGYNLSGARIGIVGLGRIGSQVASICQEMNMRVYGFDQQAHKVLPDVHMVESLEQLVKTVDVLSIHVDDHPSNENLINEELLRFAEDLFLINTSRGRIIDEQAILEALGSGKLLGYAADTLRGEGQKGGWLQNNPLWMAMASNEFNIIITPHIGGATFDNVQISEKFVIDLFMSLEREN